MGQIIGKNHVEIVEKQKKQKIETKSKVIQNMKVAIELEEFSDFMCIVGEDEEEFPVHKVILSLRSAYFDDYFKENKVSKQKSFPDVTPEIFEKVLEWIYSGKVSFAFDEVDEITQACHDFQLNSLTELIQYRIPQEGRRNNDEKDEDIEDEEDSDLDAQIFDFNERNSMRFGSAINNPQYSDIKFIVEGQEVFAHRVFLAARSKYYQAVFMSGMRECREDEIVAPLVTHNSFLAMLAFLYTGEVDYSRVDNVCDLLTLSDKLIMNDLKLHTELVIAQNFTQENFFMLFPFADQYNADWLKNFIPWVVTTDQKEEILIWNYETQQLEHSFTLTNLSIFKKQKTVYDNSTHNLASTNPQINNNSSIGSNTKLNTNLNETNTNDKSNHNSSLTERSNIQVQQESNERANSQSNNIQQGVGNVPKSTSSPTLNQLSRTKTDPNNSSLDNTKVSTPTDTTMAKINPDSTATYPTNVSIDTGSQPLSSDLDFDQKYALNSNTKINSSDIVNVFFHDNDSIFWWAKKNCATSQFLTFQNLLYEKKIKTIPCVSKEITHFEIFYLNHQQQNRQKSSFKTEKNYIDTHNNNSNSSSNGNSNGNQLWYNFFSESPIHFLIGSEDGTLNYWSYTNESVVLTLYNQSKGINFVCKSSLKSSKLLLIYTKDKLFSLIDYSKKPAPKITATFKSKRNYLSVVPFISFDLHFLGIDNKGELILLTRFHNTFYEQPLLNVSEFLGKEREEYNVNKKKKKKKKYPVVNITQFLTHPLKKETCFLATSSGIIGINFNSFQKLSRSFAVTKGWSRTISSFHNTQKPKGKQSTQTTHGKSYLIFSIRKKLKIITIRGSPKEFSNKQNIFSNQDNDFIDLPYNTLINAGAEFQVSGCDKYFSIFYKKKKEYYVYRISDKNLIEKGRTISLAWDQNITASTFAIIIPPNKNSNNRKNNNNNKNKNKARNTDRDKPRSKSGIFKRKTVLKKKSSSKLK
ncbi:hypothetical protein M0813_22818 [Anaeramoeba flamelloides]|uniref:BTB domain-containing protein n=1 Tax=Anaeramoeba flamelloides TaxID=1746091 RepID=A0ABQ8YBW0_9EUKA|nr:hypothetical protein M0813_22818 [Anaeramoeba flamelloides]